VPISGSLAFNDLATVPFSVTASGGAQRVSTVVVTTGENAATTNDTGAIDIGALPAPRSLVAQPRADAPTTLALTWVAPNTAGVTGYRIYRSATSGGPLEVIGEATGTAFVDTLLNASARYCYVVKAYDALGLVSPPTAESCATTAAPGPPPPPARINLPLALLRSP
jgi:hypothetical protein